MKGFKFAGISAGIKKNGKKDLGLIYCEAPAVAAALFTKNKVVAAPVVLGREKIKKGLCQAILVNSGNANCYTGDQGIEDAVFCSQLTADSLGISQDLVLVSSTGVIGAPLPVEKFSASMPELKNQLDSSHFIDFADAILTTDTCRKIVEKTGTINGKQFTVTGVAKGSGMIRPDMATLLAFILTDAQMDAAGLKTHLLAANKKSFSRISVDGDTSTNDSLFILANGTSHAVIEDEESNAVFAKILDQVCIELAKLVVKDGEGATKLIQIQVKGAKTPEDAFKVCETIAHSNLVKTAIYGEDPNWGRIMAAAGRSGADVITEKMDLYFDDQALVLNGRWLGYDIEKNVAQIMKNNEIFITLNLNLGQASDFFWFCDFSENYVKINADYRS